MLQKGSRDGKDFIHEPFSPSGIKNAQQKRTMLIGMNELGLREIDLSLGLQTSKPSNICRIDICLIRLAFSKTDCP